MSRVCGYHDTRFYGFLKLMRESIKPGRLIGLLRSFRPARSNSDCSRVHDHGRRTEGVGGALFRALEDKVVRPVGFEPTTRGLRFRCSTWLNYGRSPWGDHGLATPFAKIVNPLKLRNLLNLPRLIKSQSSCRPGSSPAQASGGIAKALGFVDSGLGHGAGAATVLWIWPAGRQKPRPIIGPLRSPTSDNEIRVQRVSASALRSTPISRWM